MSLVQSMTLLYNLPCSHSTLIRLQAQAAEEVRAQLEAGKAELEREREALATSRKEMDQLREETDTRIKDAA